MPANLAAASVTLVVTDRDIQLAGHTDAVEVLNSLPQTTFIASSFAPTWDGERVTLSWARYPITA